MDIEDATCTALLTGEGEQLTVTIKAITDSLTRKIELLARSVATSASFASEQGNRHVTYANGAVKPEGGVFPAIIAEDLTPEAQIRAFQRAADATYQVVLANKPPEAVLLIWRASPAARRILQSDGLHVVISTRLSWDKLREGA